MDELFKYEFLALSCRRLRNENMKKEGRPVVDAIICVTPLQALIAMRVIELAGIENYIVLFTNTFNNQKIEYYYKKLSLGAVMHQRLLMSKSKLVNYYNVYRCYKKWSRYDIRRIYFSSVNSILVQYFVARFPAARRFSFDDGTANILEASSYFNNAKRSCMRRVFEFIIRSKFNQDLLKESILTHYTIYNGQKNIVPDRKLKAISLFQDDDGSTPNNNSRNLTVFLGQPIKRYCPVIEKYYDRVVELIDPDAYLPHPAESDIQLYKNVVHTELIAEDYVMKMLQTYQSIEVYSFVSSALLNISHSRVNRFVIDVGSSHRPILEYQEIAIQLGCQRKNLKRLLSKG